jgi:hypothetical protein
LKANYHKTIKFIQHDWNSNPFRLTMETINWALNIVIASAVSFTVPDTNWLIVYPLFFTALGISIYSAISRGSFGILITSITILLIDIVGYIRIIML